MATTLMHRGVQPRKKLKPLRVEQRAARRRFFVLLALLLLVLLAIVSALLRQR